MNFRGFVLVEIHMRFGNVHCVAVYSWSIANNFSVGFYCRCLEILCQIALSCLANYFISYSLLQIGIKSVDIYSRMLLAIEPLVRTVYD